MKIPIMSIVILAFMTIEDQCQADMFNLDQPHWRHAMAPQTVKVFKKKRKKKKQQAKNYRKKKQYRPAQKREREAASATHKIGIIQGIAF